MTEKKISDYLPKTEILGQLTEELAEASAAASKLRRKIDGKNPTPKTLNECWEDKPAGELLQAACLTEETAKKYLQGHNGYGWHISDLKIYNQPKDIMCFHRAVEENELWCKKCAIGKKKDVHCAFCYGLDGLRLRRPPQSWCYVEELSNE